MTHSIYQHWGEKAADNAVALATESRLLFDLKHLPRAYYLSHMATEESAKSILLKTMGTSGTPKAEISKVSRLLRDHKKKIEFLVTYAAALSPELQRSLCDLQADLIDHINDLKNDTMYVSYKKESVVSPTDKVTNVDIGKYVQFAEALSQHAKSLLSSS